MWFKNMYQNIYISLLTQSRKKSGWSVGRMDLKYKIIDFSPRSLLPESKGQYKKNARHYSNHKSHLRSSIMENVFDSQTSALSIAFSYTKVGLCTTHLLDFLLSSNTHPLPTHTQPDPCKNILQTNFTTAFTVCTSLETHSVVQYA